MEVEDSFPTLGGIYFLPGTQINSWLKCGTQSVIDKKSGSLVFANDDGIIVLEKDGTYFANDLKNRNRSVSRTSICEDAMGTSSKTLHIKQDQNWLSKSFRKLSIASSTPPNLSNLKLNVEKPEPNYVVEDSQSSSRGGHSRSYSVSSQKEKNTLFQSIRFKIKKNQQYHSNDILFNTNDEPNTKASRRCSKFGYESIGKKTDLESLYNTKKGKHSIIAKNLEELKSPGRRDDDEISFTNKLIISSDDYKPRCFRAGILENTISKNFAIVGKTVTHEYLPEMDIVCGYVHLEFGGDKQLIPVYAVLYDYELIFFENDKCKDEIFRITTETCSAYTEPKSFEIKVDTKDKNDSKYDSKKGKDKNKSENVLKDIEADEDKDKGKDTNEEDFSFVVSHCHGMFKLHTINNSSMIRWMATINTASSNITLALHLSSLYQQNSESAFDENDHTLDIYNKEYITLVRDFNYSKVDITKDLVKNTQNSNPEEVLPSPIVYGTPNELMNKNISIKEVTSKDNEYFDKESSIKKKKNRLSDLESKFKTMEISEGGNSLDNINSNNFMDCTKLKLDSPIFDIDCVSMPILNNKKESDIETQSKKSKKESIYEKEKEDVLGEISNNNNNTLKIRTNRGHRLSCATITSVNSYSAKSPVVEDEVHFEDDKDSLINKYGMTSEDLIEGVWACEETPEKEFLDTLIYTYRHFTTADNLMEKLIMKFQEKVPTNSNAFIEEDFLQWKPVIMIRIATFIKRWLTLTTVDFRVESVRKRLNDFVDGLSNISVFENGEPLNAYMLYKDLTSLQKMFNRYIEDVLKEIDFSIPENNTPSRTKLPEFINLDPTMVAYKLTSMESERFQKIKPIEFILNLWNSNDESPYIKYEMKNLKNMVDASNHLSYWVTTEILTQPQLKPRAKVLEMFIKIAYICKKLNNYQTLFSICSGLGHSQVTRLKMTWEAIQPKYKSRFHDLEKITSIAKNYNTYRQIHANLLEKDEKITYIPFIALLIKDLYFFNDGNPKYIDESKLKNEIPEETLSIHKSTSNSNSNHASSLLGTSYKSEDVVSIMTTSTSNFSLNQDFGLESIDEVESNCSQFDKFDKKEHDEEHDEEHNVEHNVEHDEEHDDEEYDYEKKIDIDCKSEGDCPDEFPPESQIESLTTKVLSIESTTSTVTVTNTANQMINFYKLKKIMEQIRKIERCQRQAKNYSFNNLSTPVNEMELPCNYYHILNNDKILNKYSLLCEQREGEPVRMVSKWIEDNK
ncbi:ras GEF [Anaeromyces robustus]|uniref:Ras GEF n=1 Tax=Anaeromyces robustus TaxID=1754192 RepID=A0A1Y1XQT4_9FUNG|nr:ras GEF [Anaeromyces robustus]|eukprot:ORX88093.1 ras GEF [Anaeromyces robustus]